MTPIRDRIDIPERVHRDDFVLRLAEGVAQPGETLRTYVVTPQLADAFDRALDLIKGALASGSSKAAHLHGSFGRGKSRRRTTASSSREPTGQKQHIIWRIEHLPDSEP